MTLRLAFVTGATPDRWAGVWRERESEPLELVPADQPHQLDALLAGDVDLALVRSGVDQPIDRDALDLHLVRLYDEVPVVVVGLDHVLTVLEEVSTADLDAEQPDWRSIRAESRTDLRDAMATVAAGTGALAVPMSVARLHQRRDLTYRQIRDAAPTTIALTWRRDHDGPRTQAFAAITRGRGARSSRS